MLTNGVFNFIKKLTTGDLEFFVDFKTIILENKNQKWCIEEEFWNDLSPFRDTLTLWAPTPQNGRTQ